VIGFGGALDGPIPRTWKLPGIHAFVGDRPIAWIDDILPSQARPAIEFPRQAVCGYVRFGYTSR